MKKKSIFYLLSMSPLFAVAQNSLDTIPIVSKPIATITKPRVYLEKNGDSFYCLKPKTFDFLTHIPKGAAGYVTQSFQKKNLYKLGIAAASTTLLIIFDQRISNGVQSFSRRNGIDGSEKYDPIASAMLFGKKTTLGKWPKNINTAFYDLGQGSTVVYMAAGFYILGKIKADNRALQTASQLTQAFLALGVSTQLMKYATGRENPSDATVAGGRWRPFPSLNDFQNKKPKYDAFPSGHLATFVSAVAIISENYPTKRWIQPVGYSIAGLLSLAMVNNGVHWAGDYPLGFAIGYGYGKYIARKNKHAVKTPW